MNLAFIITVFIFYVSDKFHYSNNIIKAGHYNELNIKRLVNFN